MVKFVQNRCLNRLFQIAEIHNHAAFRMIGVGNNMACYGNFQTVGMPVDISASTIVAVQGVSHFVVKNFGDCDHNATKIQLFLDISKFFVSL